MRVLAGAPFQIPPWQRSAMHRTRNADHAGAAPAGGSSSPVAQSAERPILTREVDGANLSGAANFMEVKADERAAAGWKPDGAAIAACGA